MPRREPLDTERRTGGGTSTSGPSSSLPDWITGLSPEWIDLIKNRIALRSQGARAAPAAMPLPGPRSDIPPDLLTRILAYLREQRTGQNGLARGDTEGRPSMRDRQHAGRPDLARGRQPTGMNTMPPGWDPRGGPGPYPGMGGGPTGVRPGPSPLGAFGMPKLGNLLPIQAYGAYNPAAGLSQPPVVPNPYLRRR